MARAGWRGDRPLPLICLIGDPPAAEFLSELARRIGEADPPKVLFAKADAAAGAAMADHPDSEEHAADGAMRLGPPLLPLLEVLRDRLAEDRFGNQRVRRFSHFTLVDRLTRQQVHPGESRRERAEIAELLVAWHGRRSDPEKTRAEATAAARAALPLWVQIVVAVFVAWHRPVRYWLWSRRVWPFGREPRWLMRQRFMLPGHSTSFLGFAERLTARQRDGESLEELKKLVVHAFLQDLRVVYGAGKLRLRRWRRTAYILVLLDSITEDNGGWELLRLINDVRNESTDHDPLLIVATAARLPDWLAEGRTLQPVHRVQTELDTWLEWLPVRRQSLSDDARFITIRTPIALDGPPSDADESAWSALGHIRPRPVPVPARRSFLLAALTAAVTATALTGGSWLWPRIAGNCLPSPRSGVAVQWSADGRGGECVGYSDNSAQLFGDDERMRAAQRAIFELNETAEELHAVDPERPLVGIVYFSELTKPRGELGSTDSVTEQLTGLLLRQAQANMRSDHNGPLLRVIVANGGYRMGQARQVVDELLAPLFETDASLMGVVGMGSTVDPVESAIGALGDLGVPVVGTTLTGESVAGRSPMYFQLVPGNKAQAQLVKKYVEREGKPLDVYQPKNVTGDGFLQSLHDEMVTQVGEAPFRFWDGAVATVKPTCGTDRIAFFAGRQADFDGFLDRILAECAANLPTILGGDPVARFVAQSDKRDKASYAGISILYVSLGGLVVLKNRHCLTATPASQVTPLCSSLRDLRNPRDKDKEAWRGFGALLNRANMPWIGERIGIAYDSAGVFLHAVARNQTARNRIDPSGRSPNRAAISHELIEMSCPTSPDAPRGNCYDGASGEIDFRTGRAGQSRPITILRLPNVKDIAEPPACVLMLPSDPVHCPG
ncbi:MAG TPA: hypothetical protein VGX25_34820 [Actinophytocola sp.]|uniref:hypothetical protein n=1 Tax=Actinophytocola sp. TaxID=1872138 RepID=UPI002DDDA0A0|nr:hypothetical protein [Actinophytocola sp.]HEV2784585.1 hypothetical protein [Actinophytocola sp.]